MIQNILVAIGDTPHEKNAFEYAGHLAVLLDAHLRASTLLMKDITLRKTLLPESLTTRN